jgi:hypothetical protein
MQNGTGLGWATIYEDIMDGVLYEVINKQEHQRFIIRPSQKLYPFKPNLTTNTH